MTQRRHSGLTASGATPARGVLGPKLFPPETVEASLSTMRAEQQLVRTATRLTESALVALQRAFSNADELRRWLGEKLDEKEWARLEQLLARPLHLEL